VKNHADSARTVASPPLDPEDQARANWYALLSRLFYGPADSNLLAEITGVPGAGTDEAGTSDLTRAWRELQDACRLAYPPLVRQEYDALFVGVGKSEVSPYLSAYSGSSGPDRYLVRLRDRLAGWGYARRPGAFEIEDHVSGISDVMRRLIEDRHDLSDQRRFFEEFTSAGVVAFCAAVQKAPSARFYRHVATLAHAFCEIERAAFEMADAP
jgi:TorA maturation chaperone TorD